MRNLKSAVLICFWGVLAAGAGRAQNSPSAVSAIGNVRYDNRYDVYGGAAYSHFTAGPNIRQGANLGGFDVQGTRWLTGRLGAVATVRGYFGTSGAGVNTLDIHGPAVREFVFAGGAQYLGPHNVHGAITLHGMVGGAYGDFEAGLNGAPPAAVGFYPNQTAFASVVGGTSDLNRSQHLVFRISPDMVLTHYNAPSQGFDSLWQRQFAISVGLMYRFRGKR
jgi:hypothetical protein